MTPGQLARISRDYTAIAGEILQIEEIGNAVYAFGTELATLRLFRKMPNERQGYSVNLRGYYFCVEINT